MGDWWNPFDDDNLLNPSNVWKALTSLDDVIKEGGIKKKPGQVTSKSLEGGMAALEGVTTAVKATTRPVSAIGMSGIQSVSNALAFARNQLEQRPELGLVVPGFGPALYLYAKATDEAVEASDASLYEQLGGIVANTDAYEMFVRQLPGGADPDTGSGFFYGGEARESVERRQMETYPTVYGHKWTPGRDVASLGVEAGVYQEGSAAWNVISGTIDATYQIAADPLNLIGAGAAVQIGDVAVPLSRGLRAGRQAEVTTGLSSKGRKIIEKAVRQGRAVLDEEGLLTQVADEAGVLRGVRNTVAPNNYEAWKLTGKGRRVLNRMVETTDADEIWRLSNRKIPPTVVNRLAKAESYDDVVKILDDSVYSLDPTIHTYVLPGLTPDPVVTKVGATIKHNLQGIGSFLFESAPESTRLPLNDPVQASRNVDDILGMVKMPLEDEVVRVAGEDVVIKGRRNIMREFFETMDPNDERVLYDWLNDAETAVAQHLFLREGFTPDEVKSVTRWRERLTDDIKAVYSSDDLGRPMSMDYVVSDRNAPIMTSQLLNIDPQFIDPEALRLVSKRIGAVRRNIRQLRYTEGNVLVNEQDELALLPDDDRMSYVRFLFGRGSNATLHGGEWVVGALEAAQNALWKTNTLVQIRYLAKVLPDDMMRLFFSGILGDHPIQAFYRAPMVNMDVFGKPINTAVDIQRLRTEVDAAENMLNRVSGVRSAVADAAINAADEVVAGTLSLGEAANRVPANLNPDEFRTVVEAAVKLRRGEIELEEFGQILGNNMRYHKVPVGNIRSNTRRMGASGELIGTIESNMQNKIAAAQAQILRYEVDLAQQIPMKDDALAGTVRNQMRAMMEGRDAGRTAKEVALRRGHVVHIRKDDPTQAAQYAQGLVQRIGEMSANEEFQHLAAFLREVNTPGSDVFGLSQAETVRILTEHFHNGAGKSVRLNFMRGLGDRVPNWDTPGITEKWVSTMLDHFNKYTFGKDELMEAVETGLWNDMRVTEHTLGTGRFRVGGPDPAANQAFADEVGEVYMQDPAAPTTIDYFPTLTDADLFPTAVGKMVETYNRINDVFWRVAYGRSSDKLARAPMWNYAYWRAVSEVLPNATVETATRLWAEAEKLPLPEELLDDLLAGANIADGATGTATLDEIQLYARTRANQVTRDTFQFKRSRIGSAHSLSLPFFDAFREISKNMMILASNPKFIHRVDQATSEFRRNTALGPGDIDGDGEKEAFFYRDPDTGDEMISLSMLGGLGKIFGFDIGVPFGGSIATSSMSMVTQLYPSVGPVVQIAARDLVPKGTEYEGFRRFFFPYGEPDVKQVAQTFIPFIGNRNVQRFAESMQDVGPDVPVLKTFFEFVSNLAGGGKENLKQYAQILNKSLVATWASKDYNRSVEGIQQPLGAEQLEEWVQDARDMAAKVWLITSASFVTPANIQPEFFVETNKGPVMFGAIKNHWNKFREDPMNKDLSYDEQMSAFIDLYGNDGIVALLQPITDKPIQGSTASREWQSWYDNNKGLVDDNPEVAGFFGPQTAEFDDDIWSIQSAIFGISYKSAEDMERSIQSAFANFIFNRHMREFKEINGFAGPRLKFPSTVEQIAAEKSRVSGILREQFPKWNQDLARSLSTERRIEQFRQVRQLVDEPSFQDNNVAKAAKEYLSYRDQLIAEKQRQLPPNRTAVDPRTGFTRQSKQMLDLNLSLFERGEALTRQYPEFGGLWNNVLSREVNYVVEETEQ